MISSPRFVSAAVLPNGQVGLLFLNAGTEIRFKRYFAEYGLDASQQLSTAAPWYPQLATFGSRVVAAYVDTRAPNAGRLIFRVSDDSGATWGAESYPFAAETFRSDNSAPRLLASRDGGTLYVFDWTGTGVPRYRFTTDSTLATWSAWAAAGDSSMVVPSWNNCGSSGQECYRAHNFGFMETASPGVWLYIAKSPAGFGQSGRGTQVGVLGGGWSPQVDHGGSGGATGCCGESTPTTFLDRAGNIYYVRAGSSGEVLYHKKSTDGGYTWSAPLHAYSATQPNYTTGAPVSLYGPGYSRGEYVWFATFGGTEDTMRVLPLWSAPASYAESGTTRLFGSAGGDWDQGAAYPFAFGRRDLPIGIGAYKLEAEDLALPGRVLDLRLRRFYNSADPSGGRSDPVGRTASTGACAT